MFIFIINKCFPLLRLGYIERLETLQEEADLLFADAGLRQLLQRDLVFCYR